MTKNASKSKESSTPKKRATKKVPAKKAPAEETSARKTVKNRKPLHAPQRPDGSIESQILIFQLCTDDTANPDSGFQPFVLDDQSEGAWSVIQSVAQNPSLAKGSFFWGLMPAHSSGQTGISSLAWQRVIAANPGKDVYLCNPTPADEAIFCNPTQRFAIDEPRLIEVAREFFKSSGLDQADPGLLLASANFTSAPFMIATQPFWEDFYDFCSKALAKASRSLKAESLKFLSQKIKSGFFAKEPLITAILGSLLPVFLASEEGKKFSALKLAVPQKENALNVHLKSLRQLKDAAVKSKSTWLMSCWANYRNLYVFQINGKDWCQKHLRFISPTLKA